jgi:Septum formation
MERMSQPEPHEPSADLPENPAPRSRWLRRLKASSTRRALLLAALGGLLIGGLTTALPVGRHDTATAAILQPAAIPSVKSPANPAFGQAKAGDCLNWPDRTLDSAVIVDCSDDHRFEVAESVDMSAFPGSEYGPDASPPSPTRVQQITQEQCQTAVQRYLGPRFDPDSRFAVSMLWSGDRAWTDLGERRMLCGVQLPGPDNQQAAFRGKVADVDQSKAWLAGTCLGIDPTTNQQTDIPVDCAAPHAMEVTGLVNLAEKFPGGLPAEADQDGFIKDSCTRMTDAYLAPVPLRTTTLTLTYTTVSLPSWSAGSRQVSCMVGATLGNGGWATLLNGAKGPLLINGQPPLPPPDIPADRLNYPPLQLGPVPSAQLPSAGSYGPGYSSRSPAVRSDPPQQTQHMPGAPAPGPNAPQPAPPPQGNIFNPAPPDAPPAEAPPMDSPPADVPAFGVPPGPAQPPG